jgi:chorismate synthase
MSTAFVTVLMKKYGFEAYTAKLDDLLLRGTSYADQMSVKALKLSGKPMDSAEKMETAILDARKVGESLGGIVECVVLNIPAGVGGPLFDSLDGDLAKALFSIPAVKGVEFGAGFALAEMKGSEANDAFQIREGEVVTSSNLSGGILGGISSGMPILIRVAIKPTPSIEKEQQTVNLSTMKNAKLKIVGRHDPCVVPKAVPAVEAAVAITLVDHMIRAGFIPKVLREQ